MNRRLMVPFLLAAVLLASCGRKEPQISPQEVRSIAREATIYGFPLVDNYRILYSYFVDATNPEYKGSWNEIASVARVYTPEDKAVQTPNSDTPYSMLGVDLRAEPLVLTLPPIDKKRYYSAQFIDLYTHNFAYAGSRTSGNDGGVFLLAGPGWSGTTPAGVTAVFRCETELALVVYRTQLLDARDIDEVRDIQMRYKVQPLSRFLSQAPPEPAPAIDFVKPLSAADERKSLEFFGVLNFLLQYCPTHPSETELMARLAKIGIGAGKPFSTATLEPEIVQAIKDGCADAWAAYDSTEHLMQTGALTSGQIFGTRDYLKNNYLYRMVAAVDGIYGNSQDEAIYPGYVVDAGGQPLDGSAGHYTIRFSRDQLPPVNAFWSLTMYDAGTKLLVANPIERYLINSSMLPKLKKDKDGGVTLYIQYPSPGPGKQANWLPAPNGPFFIAMRLYWPKPEALNGTWKKPRIERAK